MEAVSRLIRQDTIIYSSQYDMVLRRDTPFMLKMMSVAELWGFARGVGFLVSCGFFRGMVWEYEVFD